jgi:hypothetical protein
MPILKKIWILQGFVELSVDNRVIVTDYTKFQSVSGPEKFDENHRNNSGNHLICA